VDVLIRGLQWGAVQAVDGSAVAPLDPAAAREHGLAVSGDLTFCHPGAYMYLLREDELADPLAVGKRASALKVAKYRATLTAKSLGADDILSAKGEQHAFLPLPMSVAGRLYPEMDRLVNRLVSGSVARRIASRPDDVLTALGLSASQPEDLDHGEWFPPTAAAISMAVRSAKCRLSTLSISHLIQSMFDQTKHVASPPFVFRRLLY
jgi:hypothetical protein